MSVILAEEAGHKERGEEGGGRSNWKSRQEERAGEVKGREGSEVEYTEGFKSYRWPRTSN